MPYIEDLDQENSCIRDNVDLIESTVYPLLNVAVNVLTADMVTSVPVSRVLAP